MSLLMMWLCAWSISEAVAGVLCEAFLWWWRGRPSAPEVPRVFHGDTAASRALVDCGALRSFAPCPWAPWGMSQTVLALVALRGSPRYDRRIHVETPDGVVLSLDVKEKTTADATTPVVLVLHGLAGDSGTDTIRMLTDAFAERGWRAVAYNRRGHGDGCIDPAARTRKAFPLHSDPDDLALVTEHLTQTYPGAKMAMVGVSEGANALVHYLGSRAPPVGVCAAVSFSNGWDLERGAQLAESRRPYMNELVVHYKKSLLVKNLSAVRRGATIHDVDVDVQGAMRATDLRAFDAALTVPLYGFRNVDEFFRRQSSVHVLADVRTRLLCVNGDDDPFFPGELSADAVDTAPRDNVIFVRTARGGHAAWLQGWSGKSWMVDVSTQYIEACLRLA